MKEKEKARKYFCLPWYGTVGGMVPLVWYRWYGAIGMVPLVWYRWYGTIGMVPLV